MYIKNYFDFQGMIYSYNLFILESLKSFIQQ